MLLIGLIPILTKPTWPHLWMDLPACGKSRPKRQTIGFLSGLKLGMKSLAPDLPQAAFPARENCHGYCQDAGVNLELRGLVARLPPLSLTL